MCGIAGYAGKSNAEIGVAGVAAMNAAQSRRGPDSEGQWGWPEATLGHRRLAILDLSQAGQQPMVSRDGQVGLVFNGCIYNFAELRAELEQAGRSFRSRTDTEVLLEGYLHWGLPVLLERVRGMYAFGIWDNRSRSLLLVRDRLGVKPLYYAWRGGELAFASTAAALWKAGWAEAVDPEAVLEYLEFGWVGEGRSIYTNVRKVGAGHCVVMREGSLEEKAYWRVPESGSHPLRFGEAVEETERLLVEAVRLRLAADVPVGSLLSGGIDSGLIAWALRKLNANVKCFTVGARGHAADESEAAAATARKLGLEQETVWLDGEQTPDLETLAAAFGEPFAVSSALGMLKICGAVKQRATVLLTGDGGDDVFLGYPHHRNILWAQQLARVLPPGSRRWWPALRRYFGNRGLARRAKHWMDYAVEGLGAVTRVHDGLPYFLERGLLGAQLAGRRLADREIGVSPWGGRRVLEDYLRYERQTRFVAEYMTKVDGAAMYHALEARSPFLDQKLWEMAAALPQETHLRGGQLKAILRALAEKHLGREVAQRRKQGFTVPVTAWLRQGWRGMLEALRSDALVVEQGWIEGSALRRALREIEQQEAAPVQLWTVLVLEHWLRGQAAASRAKGRERVPAPSS